MDIRTSDDELRKARDAMVAASARTRDGMRQRRIDAVIASISTILCESEASPFSRTYLVGEIKAGEADKEIPSP